MPSSFLTDLDQLILAFLTGFVVATLIFWPMVHRRRSRDRAARTTSGRDTAGRENRSREGRHALRPGTTAPTPKTTTAHDANTDGGARTQPSSAPSVVTAHPRSGTTPAESDRTDVPEPRAQQPVELPPPTDLFQQHYAARFDRARNRAARIREQLDQT